MTGVGLVPDGPSVVAIGGGHGLAASLRALRRVAGSLVGVVTVADDGGSTGRLREHMDQPAVGDLRRCVSALADPDGFWGDALEHRFGGGDLDDHALGNIIVYGLAQSGLDFLAACDEIQRLAGCVGRILPASIEPVRLSATLRESGRLVEGQVAVATTGPVERLHLHPDAPAVPDEVVGAIAAADMVVLGPGSLFTSVIAAASVPAIADAVAASSARKVWVANLSPQKHETTGFTLDDHLAALAAHGVAVDVALRHPGALEVISPTVPVVEAKVATDDGLAHHPERLAKALTDLVSGAIG